MDTNVQKTRVSSLILRSLREIFLHEMAGSLGNVLITVTHLHTCPKTGNVKAYLSFMPSQNGPKAIEEIEQNRTKIRGLLGKQLASKIRHIPHIKFCLDTSIERAFHLERLLNGFQVSRTHMDVQPAGDR